MVFDLKNTHQWHGGMKSRAYVIYIFSSPWSFICCFLYIWALCDIKKKKILLIYLQMQRFLCNFGTYGFLDWLSNDRIFKKTMLPIQVLKKLKTLLLFSIFIHTSSSLYNVLYCRVVIMKLSNLDKVERVYCYGNFPLKVVIVFALNGKDSNAPNFPCSNSCNFSVFRNRL